MSHGGHSQHDFHRRWRYPPCPFRHRSRQAVCLVFFLLMAGMNTCRSLSTKRDSDSCFLSVLDWKDFRDSVVRNMRVSYFCLATPGERRGPGVVVQTVVIEFNPGVITPPCRCSPRRKCRAAQRLSQALQRAL